MNVKCQSCGAPQASNSELNCTYCGVQLTSKIEISDKDHNELSLAFYEYKKGNLSKALLLFEDIIKVQESNPSAWIYKVNCELRLNTPNSDDYKEFEQSVNWLIEKFGGNKQLLALIEKALLDTIHFLFQLRIKRPIPKINMQNVEGFLESQTLLSVERKEDSFFKVISRLAQFFPSSFSKGFLSLLNAYLHNLANNNFYNKKLHSRILAFPEILFDLTYLLSKAQLNLTEYFLSIFKSIEYASDDYKTSRNGAVDQCVHFSDLHLSTWRFSETEIQEIKKLDINYQLIKQYLLTLKVEPEIEKPAAAQAQKEESKKGCFIATAALGDYDHPVVVDLREFRDNRLLKRPWGIKFTEWYYRHGPYWAKVIKTSILLKKTAMVMIVLPVHQLTRLLRKNNNNLSRKSNSL